jgi:hypothetical protein
MKSIVGLAAAGCLCLCAAGAIAQQPVSTQILLAGNSCTAAADAGGAPQGIIDTCNKAIADIQAIKGANTLNPHETNLYNVMVSLAHTTIGSKMGAIDGARTSRVCGELESSWSFLSKLIPGNSPPDYASDMYTLQQRAVAPLKLCRSEFGTPAGAPRLPPE